MFAQDVDSKENMRSRRRDSKLGGRESSVESLGHCQRVGNGLHSFVSRRVDLRVFTLPTQYGEKVVMRLLEGESPLKDFAVLGIPKEIADALS